MISTSVYIFSMSYLPYSFFVYASKYLFKSSYKFPVHSSIHHYSTTFFPFHKNIHKLCISHSLSLAFSFLPYLSPYFISFLRPLSVALSLSTYLSVYLCLSLCTTFLLSVCIKNVGYLILSALIININLQWNKVLGY